MAKRSVAKRAKYQVGVRAVHLDLKGTPPTSRRLIRLLDIFRESGYNALCVEWEDMFPWTVDARFRCETAYTPREVERFAAEAAARGMEIIPLVQCLGHMETPLSLPEYAHLREIPYRSDVLNPLAPGARDLVLGMIDDVLALTPEVKWFHLGGDEAWTLGRGEESSQFVKKHGKAALYLQHVDPLIDHLKSRGVRPILWSDMMHDWPIGQLRKIAKRADLCPWGYSGHPDRWQHHSATKYIERFAAAGATLWGATAYKGATEHNADLCDFDQQEENALAWREVAERFGSVGLIATAWSRHSTHRAQTQPIDGCLDSLVSVGRILRDGRAPGREKCLEILDAMGEGKRFAACREALVKLADARYWGWGEVSRLREQVALETVDVRRRESGTAMSFLVDLKRHLEVGASGASADMRKAYRGLMQDIWIERYLSERVEPLLEELSMLEPRVRLLEPAQYAAAVGKRKWNS